MTENPFAVKNPEDLSPEYIAQHFVDMFTDFAKVRNPENSFIHGARGTGKSMMMRGLETAVMLKTRTWTLSELPHLGIHVPLRRGDFSVPELSGPSPSVATAISEHLLIIYITSRLARSLKGLVSLEHGSDIAELTREFSQLFAECGGSLPERPAPDAEPDSNLKWIMDVCDRESTATRQFSRRIPFFRGDTIYAGALCGFLDFLLPLLSKLTSLGSMPGVPVYIMLDDADNLPVVMQRVLNSWVAKRVVDKVCLKITTQLGYATYRTIDGRLIETPHDFNEIDIASVYTKSHDRFSKRVREIAAKRLSLAGIDRTPEEFFPEDQEQRRKLEQIASDIRAEWSDRREKADPNAKRGGNRQTDDVVRYTIPRYMRLLSGSSKSSHTFSYAGLSSLVDLSSGVIRWFLEPAARMYDEVASRQQRVAEIPCHIQDAVIYAWSREFAERLRLSKRDLADEIGGSVPEADGSLQAIGHEGIIAARLHNVIAGLGQFFRMRLLDEAASEQRAFSIVVRGKMAQELGDVLDYGVRMGYLQRADNAAKEAYGGRNPRYILARRLGPYFKLDVSGYAAHISVTADDLLACAHDPSGFARRRSRARNSAGQLEFDLLPTQEDDE